jgi:hypothetical protein
VRVNGNPLGHATWRFAPEQATPPTAVMSGERKHQQTLTNTALHPAVSQWASCRLPRNMERGTVITMDGHDCHGELFADDVMIGRFVFGPTIKVTFKGGPANTFYVPARLATAATTLHLHMRGAGSGGQVRTVALSELVLIRTDAFLEEVDATTDLPVRP